MLMFVMNTLFDIGEILSVGDTVFDLRIPKHLGDVIPKTENGFGFDNNLCVNQDSLGGNTFVSRYTIYRLHITLVNIILYLHLF